MSKRDKIVVVTRKTALEELIERFNTHGQARFYIEHMGGSFDDYQAAHDAYQEARDRLHASLPKGVRTHWIDRSFLPTFTFGENELIVTLGQDGLVVNTAKYLDGQPLVAVNPDPARIDGLLIPFSLDSAPAGIASALLDELPTLSVTMAKATLNDGQTLYAVNDLFIGARTHISARYRLVTETGEEDQSSSGIIVTTGAGSTGWYRSIVTGAAAIATAGGSSDALRTRNSYRFDWEAPHLVFAVREPFISKTSGAELIHGRVTRESPLTIVSHMPQNGVIFSDGIEEDRLDFNSGAVARIEPAERVLRLVMPEARRRTGPRDWTQPPTDSRSRVQPRTGSRDWKRPNWTG